MAKVYIVFKDQPQECDEPELWSCLNWTEYVLLIIISVILLVASLALTILWAVNYRGGVAWNDSEPEKNFNLHPILMTAGFITLSGSSILLYRVCRCMRRIHVKCIHTIFHVLAMPCIGAGLFKVWEYHNHKHIPHLYSLHSWIGCITVGMFVLQFGVGFFSFLILLRCGKTTSGYRADLVPVHATFGLLSFMLAIATCLTGFSQKVFTKEMYRSSTPEYNVAGFTGIVLVGLAIVYNHTLRKEELRYRAHLALPPSPEECNTHTQ